MILCIDLGSTSFKACLYDKTGICRGAGAARLSYHQFSGQVELLPETIQPAVRYAVRDALNSAGAGVGTVTSLAVTSQAQTMALRVDNQFLTPFISWRDQRGKGACARLNGHPAFADFAEHGCLSRLSPALMPCLVAAASDGLPPGAQADVIPLPTYIIEVLTGARVLDENLAGMTGLWSLRDRCWHPGYLRAIGITQQQLPKVVPLLRRAATLLSGKFLDLPGGIPVFCCGNDQSAAACAADIDLSGGALITLGSAQVVYRRCAALPPADTRAMRGLFPAEGYFRLLADGPGGHLISRIIEQLNLGDFETFFALATEGCSADLPLPEINAESIPVTWSRPEVPVALRCAAAIEHLVESLASALDYLGVDPCHDTLLLANSGGARNAVWRERIAARLGVAPQLCPATPDRGAAQVVIKATDNAGNGNQPGKYP